MKPFNAVPNRHGETLSNYYENHYNSAYGNNVAYPAMSMRRMVGSVEVVLFTSSRSKSICAATLGWALICKKI